MEEVQDQRRQWSQGVWYPPEPVEQGETQGMKAVELIHRLLGAGTS